MTKALHQLQAIMDAQQASAAQRENALQAQLADLSDLWNLNTAEAETRTDAEPRGTQTTQISFIGPQAISKLTNFDSKAASCKDWTVKFENMAAAVVPSSREAL